MRPLFLCDILRSGPVLPLARFVPTNKIEVGGRRCTTKCVEKEKEMPNFPLGRSSARKRSDICKTLMRRVSVKILRRNFYFIHFRGGRDTIPSTPSTGPSTNRPSVHEMPLPFGAPLLTGRAMAAATAVVSATTAPLVFLHRPYGARFSRLRDFFCRGRAEVWRAGA